MKTPPAHPQRTPKRHTTQQPLKPSHDATNDLLSSRRLGPNLQTPRSIYKPSTSSGFQVTTIRSLTTKVELASKSTAPAASPPSKTTMKALLQCLLSTLGATHPLRATPSSPFGALTVVAAPLAATAARAAPTMAAAAPLSPLHVPSKP